MQAAIRIAIKKASHFIFQLGNPFNRQITKPPGHILIRQPFAANNSIHEMAFNRIAATKRHIIAALYHTGTAAFANKPLYRKGDF